jgi:hypothetical protein
MAPKTHNSAGKATSVPLSAKARATRSTPSGSSSVGSQAGALGNIGHLSRLTTHRDDDDLCPDNQSPLCPGTYIITNVGRKLRAALCSPDDQEGVVSSLDGTNVIQEAGDEVRNQILSS